MTSGIDSSALQVGRSGIKATQDNLVKSQIKQAKRVDASVVTGYNGIGVRTVYARADNPHLNNFIRENASKLAGTDVIAETYSSLELFISKDEGADSRLTGAINDFIGKSKILAESQDPAPAVRKSFLLEAEKLTNTFNDHINKINEARFRADQDLSNNVQAVNETIRELFEINKGLAANGDINGNLRDSRDIALNKLSEYFEINVSFGSDNKALVRTKDGTVIIGDKGQIATLNYTPWKSIESMLQGGKINPVTLSYSSQYAPITVISENVNKITGGKFDGLIELRDKLLPESLSAVKNFTESFVNGFNKINNMGSTFPPKTKFQGNKLLKLSDRLDFSGKVNFAIVDSNGHAENGSSGKVNQMVLDFDNLQGKTTKDVLREINEQLNYGPSAPRLRLGAINDNNGLAIPGQSLLNDIKIRSKSNIDGGNFTFDLDLNGNEFFGSKVEVITLSAGGVPIPEDQLPPVFDLRKGQHVCTNHDIKLNGFAAGSVVQIKIRVTGENGVVEEGTAGFTIPNDPNLLNKRIVGVIPGGIFGNQMAQGAITHAPIARARLVDKNGVPIDLNDNSEEGYLVIESISNDCRVIISENDSKELETGKGFKHYFGLNNFFDLKQDGTIESLIKNPEDLAIGMVQAVTGAATIVKIGNVAAQATMQFNGVPIDGGTVTIDGVIYTFRNAPAATNDVGIDGGGLIPTLQNLVDSINTTRSISSKIEATTDGIDTITIRARNVGISGNAITLATTAALAAPLPAGNLIGGTDQDQTITGKHFEIGNNSKENLSNILRLLHEESFEIDGYTGSLASCASVTIGTISSQILNAKNNAKVAETTLKQLSAELNKQTGIDQHEERIKLTELAQYYQTNLAVFRIYREIFNDFMRSIAG